MRDAWLAGWDDQKAFAGCQTAGRISADLAECVIGSVSFALFGTWAVWGHYHSSEAYGHYRTLAGWTPGSTAPDFIPDPPDQSWHVAAGAVVLLFSLLPFIIVAVIRRIAMGRWRFGPRW